MTEQQTLVEFLEKRLREDEAAAHLAQAVSSSRWIANGSLLMYLDDADPPYAEALAEVENYRQDDILEHTARHDPARVLREVAAKRAILEHLLQWPHHVNYEDADWGNSCAKIVDPASRCDCDVEELVNTGIRHLAAVYSDHPEY